MKLFAGLGGRDARVGSQAVEVLETFGVRPGWKMRPAQLGEAFLKAGGLDACEGIAGGNRTTDARIAAFDGDFTETETDDAAQFGAEELIFPECGHTIDFEIGAKAHASFRDGQPGKPFANGIERCGGDDRGSAGDAVIRDAVGVVADHDGLFEIFREPRGRAFGVAGERESRGVDCRGIRRHGEGNL